MNLHYPTCARWVKPAAVCTCPPTPQPRPWRVRRDPTVHDGHPWTVSRLMNSDGYETLLRAATFERAMALVRAFADLEQCLLR